MQNYFGAKINFKTFLNCTISNTVSQLQSEYKNNSIYSTRFLKLYSTYSCIKRFKKYAFITHEQCFVVPS